MTDALRLLFEERGYRVSVAGTVASARAIAAESAPSVALVDVALPDGDGLALVEEWKAAGSSPAVLALTGSAERDTRERCLTAGCSAVLVKPVPIAELVQRVDALG